jgi:carbon monoxide dehydrogenase subunit G
MEVKLDRRYPLKASTHQAWVVLADIRATAACMPGAQITDQTDTTRYKGVVKSKVGPAVMSFTGDIEVLELDAADYRLQLLGTGADKSGSSATMKLTAQIEAGETPDSAVLVGQALITVNGKLAQFGSRLLVPVSDAMLAQFADNFRAAAAIAQAGAGAASATEPRPSVRPTPGLAPPVKELNALALLWSVIKGWWVDRFTKKA